MSNKPRVLLVMHKVPLDSGFLAEKFIRLSEQMDVHLLVWDKQENADKFINKHKLHTALKKNIHFGYTHYSAILFILQWLVCFISQTRFRQYIISGDDNLIQRIKYTLTYLPVSLLQPNIVHFEFGTIAQQGVIIKSFIDAKLSVSFRGYDLNYAGIDNSKYYDSVWNQVDGFHFLGNDLKQRAISRGYIPDKIEALIPPAIDTAFFVASNTHKNYEKLQLISVGRLVWKKGYEYAIRAALLLKRKGIPFEYKIIGEGSHRQALEFMIKESGLENQVSLMGERDAEVIKQELKQAHIFVHPAISEGFSNAVLEAQAMGLPVVCTDADGLAENIADGVTGFIVHKWDEHAIATKLEMLWNNRDMMKAMGNAGIGRVQNYFTIEKQIAAFKAFYQKLYSETNS
ncbi:MAG: glycosyltransferase family 4 protein [Flavipsychrobacter sp.]|nr:glycosyltransferase family 4 protein [Flavipsychrobacter sp.]